MSEDEETVITDAIDTAEKVKERLKTDPDAVRKILSSTVSVEEDVTVYPNKALNIQYTKFSERLGQLAGAITRNGDETDEEYLQRSEHFRPEYEKLTADFDELKSKIEASAVTFHLISVSKKTIKNIRTAARKKFPVATDPLNEDVDDAEIRDDWYKAAIVAAHLEGYTIEDIENIRDEWPQRAWAQLWTTAQKLSIADDYLGAAFNADF